VNCTSGAPQALHWAAASLTCADRRSPRPLLAPDVILVAYGSTGETRTTTGTDVLFRDFLVPLGSIENTDRIAKISARDKLEGFPLLHVDFYISLDTQTHLNRKREMKIGSSVFQLKASLTVVARATMLSVAAEQAYAVR
jgi:hypothetical protein